MSLRINTATEGARNYEVVLSDFGSISRESVTLAAGQSCAAGTVLGVVTASGEYALHDEDATDGTKVAAAVLLTSADATAADQVVVVQARLAEVKTALLIFKAGATAGAKTAAITALAARNIIAR